MSKKTSSTERTETLTSTLVEALAQIAQMGGCSGYVQVPAYLCRGTHAKLKYWGLIETDPTAKRSGRWRVTDFGIRFLRGQETVKEIAVVKDDQVVRFEGRRGKLRGGADLPELAQPADPRMGEIVAGILADG